MKFKLLGALGVAAVGVMGLGLTNTGAWFTDQETTDVSASAGTLNINLGGEASTSVSVGPLFPGEETRPYTLKIVNPGTPTNATVRYQISTENGAGDLIGALQVRLEHGNCVTGFEDPRGSGQPDAPWVTDITPVTDDVGPQMVGASPQLLFDSDDSVAGVNGLAKNNTHCYTLWFSMPDSAGNGYQGDTGTFDVVVDATQLGAPLPFD